MSNKSGAIVRRDDARAFHAFGEEVTILLDGEQTAGKLTMWTEITAPGGGPPQHYHVNEDETFHVLEGQVAFLSDGEWRMTRSRSRRRSLHAARRRSYI